jgi:hypothetical protein
MFRFTIRDVLWLTVVVGLLVALFVERRHKYSERFYFYEEISTIRQANKSLETQLAAEKAISATAQ